MNNKNILVCVTQQKNCEHLITLASKIERGNGEITVLHILGNNDKFLNNTKESEALEHLFTVSKSVGAPMTVLRSDDSSTSIAEFIHSNNINTVILGESHELQDRDSFSTLLQRKNTGCEILIL